MSCTLEALGKQGVNDIWKDYVIIPYVFDHGVDNARKAGKQYIYPYLSEVGNWRKPTPQLPAAEQFSAQMSRWLPNQEAILSCSYVVKAESLCARSGTVYERAGSLQICRCPLA